MVNISPRSAGGPTTDDPSWLYSDSGINDNLTVTLDVSLFTEGTHFPNGFIPSGTPIAKVTSTGLYGPYDNGASDGRQTAEGFLYAPLTVKDDLGTLDTVVGACYNHGNVVEARLPIAIDSAGKTDLAGRVKFV